MKKYDLSLIIPAYNEENKIKKDIDKAFLFFRKSRINAEIIISSNGTTDKTIKIVKGLQKRYKGNLKILETEERIGKGGAIKKAVNKALGKFIIFADSGYCVPYKYIKIGLAILEKGIDVAIADRRHSLSIVEKRQVYRELASVFFNFFCRYLLGIPKDLKDTQCGFKIFKSKVGKSIFKDLKTKGMMFDVEIILRAKAKGFKIAPFPIEWHADKISKLHPVYVLLKSLKEIFYIKIVYKL